MKGNLTERSMTTSSQKNCLTFSFLPKLLRFIPNCPIEAISFPVTKQPCDNVIITFIDQSSVETTYHNALRLLLNHGKLLMASKKMSCLTLQEKVNVEELLLQCSPLKNANDLLSVFNKSLKFTNNNVPFLIKENALTCVDLLFYSSLYETENTIKLPQLHHWLTILNSFFDSLNDGNPSHETTHQTNGQKNFIRSIVEQDLKQGKHRSIVTRFPPEPNGFLHLGHAKSICLNFGLAKDFGGVCHLRFDDTNPTKENLDYIEAIQKDVQWLGGNYGHHLYYTSDYFDQLYEWAVDLIKKELAYVDDQTEEELKKNRGDLFTPGINSIYRNRSVEENLKLFFKMKNGEFPEGKCVLRAKIDMSHGNLTMRDPILYRIRYHCHARTQNKWCIYPMYDFAHGQSDSIERITHSLCTLEFEDRRPLYNWFQEKLNIFRTSQIEFARLNCTYTVMSKRKLLALVEGKYVNGWDDPRLPTISGLRRKGYPPEAIRDFCDKIGVAKRETIQSFDYLELCVTTALHSIALRRSVVTQPLTVIITNFPENHVETLVCRNHPEDESLGVYEIHFNRELYIEQGDFMISPSEEYHRLSPNVEVRLRHSYWIKCHDYKCDALGNVIEVYCTYDPLTKGGVAPPQPRKVKGTLHWVSTYDAINVELRKYTHLFTTPTPFNIPEDMEIKDCVNKKSLEILNGKGHTCLKSSVHPYKALDLTSPPCYFQFERVGFFVPDYDSTQDHPIMNLTVALTDTYSILNEANCAAAQKKATEKALREKIALERKEKKQKRLLKAQEKLAMSQVDMAS